MSLFPHTKSAEDISERDAGHLLAACRLPTYDEKTGQKNNVPDPVAKFYWQVKQHFDRVGGTTMQPDTYAVIAALGYALAGTAVEEPAATVEKEEESPAANVAQLFHSKQLAHGDPVLVNWREEWKEARILGASNNRRQVTVQIVGDSEERKVPTSTVKPHEAAMV